MTAEQQNFSGGAVATTLTSILNTGDLTMQVASTTNYPASGLPFVLTVDEANVALQESVFVRSWTGTTITLDSVKGRGYDGTSARQHQLGAPVVHTPDAAFLADLSARAFAVTTQGDLPYVSASAGVVMSRLPIGAAYWVVGSNGSVPVYQSSPQSVMTGTGDILYSSAPNTMARLVGGSANNGKVLVVSGGLPTWGSDPAVATETSRAETAEAAETARAEAAETVLSNGSPTALLTTLGDLIVRGASAPIRLAAGTAGQVLGIASGSPAWENNQFTPTTKSSAYTAVNNDHVVATASITVTLPAPSFPSMVGVSAIYAATSATPVTVTTPSGHILGPGLGTGVTSVVLGGSGAFVVLASDGTNWYVVAGAQDTGWLVTTSFAGSWSGSLYYRLKGDMCYLGGNISGGGSTQTPLTLPAGYRPSMAQTFLVSALVLASPGSGCAVAIATSGALTVYFSATSPTINLDGIAFPVS